MANINKGALPRIADIQCSKMVFFPGDRLLVKTQHRLDKDQRHKLKKSIRKWAGCDVEILIYDSTQLDIKVDRNRQGLIQP